MIGPAAAKLLDIAGERTGGRNIATGALPADLAALLAVRNGFFAFESALEVFPGVRGDAGYSISEWNEQHLWKNSYGLLQPIGLCFAQDLFGVQFVLSDCVYTFEPETAALTPLADSVELWAERLLADYDVLTGYTLAHKWQLKHGRLPGGLRLAPITPFVLGGKFELENLVAMDSVKAMRVRGELALQLKDLPDGAPVRYQVV